MNSPILPLPKVLAFDVFGTAVDWHGGIYREVQALRPAVDVSPRPANTRHAREFMALADQLGC